MVNALGETKTQVNIQFIFIMNQEGVQLTTHNMRIILVHPLETLSWTHCSICVYIRYRDRQRSI